MLGVSFSEGMEDFLVELNKLEGLKASFLTRYAGVPVDTDKEATVKRLEPNHRKAVEKLGFSWDQLWRAEQVHGAKIAKISVSDERNGDCTIGGVDGLVTADRGVLLGIYVADCGAIYMADKETGAIGLLHSGKKGTELNILKNGLDRMKKEFGTKPENVMVRLAPCIRPPAYEIDFAKDIQAQAKELGIKKKNFTDCGICTSSDLDTYYSYRIEQGATGRMLALLGRI